MNTQTFFIYLIVMAGVTYLIRAIPLTVFTGKIENRFIKSFLALAYKRKSLLTVAVAACLAVLLVSVIELAL